MKNATKQGANKPDMHEPLTQPNEEGSDANWLKQPGRGYRITKRLIDIVFSTAALLVLAPAYATIAIAIMLTSRGPVYFREERLGLHGKPFAFLKFRTMYPSIEQNRHRDYLDQLIAGASSPVTYRITADPRLTPIGRFLRRTSLDELPQFINVLKGEMSLVGPRPPLPYEVECYDQWHKLRLSVKPGITGLWQIKGRSTSTFDEMVQMDLEYIKSASIPLDLRILLKTPRAAFTGGWEQ